jgi:AraC-like DNA-binding protein
MSARTLVYNRGPKMRPFFDLAREAGVDVEGELSRAGWSEQELLRPDVELEREASVELFRLIRRLCRDPLLGLRGAARFEPADLDVLGFLITQCEHVLAAMQAMGHYARLAGDALASEVERDGRHVLLRLGLSGGRTQLPEVVDYHVGVAHVTFSKLTAERCRPIEVWLARPKPERPRPWADFFGCPVQFGAAVSTLLYREVDALIPFDGASKRLKAILVDSATERLTHVPDCDDFVARVRAVLDARLEGAEPTAAAIARALGLGERTLRRRLQAHGTSLREVTHRVRRQRALTLVRSSELTVSEMAHRCGFSDGAAFARAFRRWTGLAPGEAMQAQRARRF